jgi:hypothetical protein
LSDLSEDELDRLLSRGGLGQEQKRRMLGNVLASVEAAATPRRRSRWRWPAVAVLSLSGAVAVAALWARPSGETRPDFREKGAPAAVPILAMSCLGGSLGACPAGSRLAFWLEGGPQEPGVITAYADPVAGGERVWYLTNEKAPRAALIGKEQPSGRYRVTVVLTRHPVARAELAALDSRGIITHANFDLVVSP